MTARDESDAPQGYRAGYVGVLGRPNVGKSTLVNALVGTKVSITSPRPQTTRYQVLGIDTGPSRQIVYADSPGLNQDTRTAMNRYLNRAAHGLVPFADVLLVVLEADRWTDDDARVLRLVDSAPAPLVVALNKMDRLPRREALLPAMERLAPLTGDAPLVPVSALRRDNLDALEQVLEPLLPVGEALYPGQQVTDKGLRFQVAELVRERLFRLLRQELPYSLAVEVERLDEQAQRLDIDVVIWVSRPAQKPIVIGRSGERLKAVGSEARQAIERLVDRPVDLRLWVKVKAGWMDDERALKSMGYLSE